MSTDTFYSNLFVHTDFSAVSDLSNFTPLPNDWYVLAADVQNSTGAIEAGQYKSVNIAGVSIITSVKNLARPLELPYIFGGDGATLCIPPVLLEESKEALVATREMAEEQFGLYLRVGVVPINDIRAAGFDVLVLRHRMSEYCIQAAFSGGGIEYAENLIKDESKGEDYRLKNAEESATADYSGLECRWDSVPSERGETISLIVKALASSIEQEATIYNQIIEKIKNIYGDDDICRPVYENGLKLKNSNRNFFQEVKLRTFGDRESSELKYKLLLHIQVIMGRIFMALGLKTGDVQWGDYKTDVANNTDFKKFDGVLREVISGSSEQREELDSYLRQKYEKGECVYGIHVSDSALITCMINNRNGDHYHFVDGTNGGYAMAAAAMKKQQRELNV